MHEEAPPAAPQAAQAQNDLAAARTAASQRAFELDLELQWQLSAHTELANRHVESLRARQIPPGFVEELTNELEEHEEQPGSEDVEMQDADDEL